MRYFDKSPHNDNRLCKYEGYRTHFEIILKLPKGQRKRATTKTKRRLFIAYKHNVIWTGTGGRRKMRSRLFSCNLKWGNIKNRKGEKFCSIWVKSKTFFLGAAFGFGALGFFSFLGFGAAFVFTVFLTASPSFPSFFFLAAFLAAGMLEQEVVGVWRMCYGGWGLWWQWTRWAAELANWGKAEIWQPAGK